MSKDYKITLLRDVAIRSVIDAEASGEGADCTYGYRPMRASGRSSRVAHQTAVVFARDRMHCCCEEAGRIVSGIIGWGVDR